MSDQPTIYRTDSILDEMKDVHDHITQRAYELFLQDGSRHGRHLEHWCRAENEILPKPVLELCEKDRMFRLEVAFPGVDTKDISIAVAPEQIQLEAHARHEHNKDTGEVQICEFQTGKLFRSVHLTKKIDPEKVKAEFKNGLLTLTAEIAQDQRTTKVLSEAA
jgi:HSP20 family molecular chaperone IbpA